MEYIRGSKDLTYARADHITIAKDFINEFERNVKAASKKFINKIIGVKGSVKDVRKDDDKFYTIMLGDSANTSSVRCSMDADHQSAAAVLLLGSNVTIKGVCTGFTADDLLGFAVILDRCMIEKKEAEYKYID